MRRHEAIEAILSHADELRAIGVSHVSVFGSIARDQGTEESDLDLIVDGPPGRRMTLFDMARARTALERMLGERIDLTAQEGLENTTELRRRVSGDLVRVF